MLKKNRAIYFPSYQILESYAALASPHISRRKVFIEPRDAAGAGAALNEFLSLPSQGESGIMFAVCGGKWSEGLDYRGEMLSGAMVVGLPLAPFTRVRKMVIEYFRHKYGRKGSSSVIRSRQSTGRSRRSGACCGHPRIAVSLYSVSGGFWKKGCVQRCRRGFRTR